MPEMDGPTLAEAVLALRPETRVLYMSGYAADEAFRNRVERGCGGLSRQAFLAHRPGEQGAGGLGRVDRVPGSIATGPCYRWGMTMTVLPHASLLARLVAFDSTSHRSNLPIADFICNYLDRPGVRIERLPSADGEKVNLCITVGPEVDPLRRDGLVFSGHMDVVPAGEPGWNSDPFSLVDGGDRWVARGACDMKGFDALAINIAASCAGRSLRQPLVLILTYDEEIGTVGAHDFARDWPEDRPLPRRAVIGEPTSLEVVRLHKGHCKMRFTVRGQAAHSGYPHLGASAIEPAARAVGALADLRATLVDEACPQAEHFPEVPFVALNVGTIRGGRAVNIIPEACTVELGFSRAAGHALGADRRADLVDPRGGAGRYTVRPRGHQRQPTAAGRRRQRLLPAPMRPSRPAEHRQRLVRHRRGMAPTSRPRLPGVRTRVDHRRPPAERVHAQGRVRGWGRAPPRPYRALLSGFVMRPPRAHVWRPGHDSAWPPRRRDGAMSSGGVESDTVPAPQARPAALAHGVVGPRPLALLADSRPLFEPAAGALLRRLYPSSDDAGPRTAFVGAASGDDDAALAIFCEVMNVASWTRWHPVPAAPSSSRRAWLAAAEVVVLGGGDPVRGLQTLARNGLGDVIRRARAEGAGLVGISAGAMMLGIRPSIEADPAGLACVDAVVGAHEEDRGWAGLRRRLAHAPMAARGIGLPGGGGLILHGDGTEAALRLPVVELRRDASGSRERLLLPGTRR